VVVVQVTQEAKVEPVVTSIPPGVPVNGIAQSGITKQPPNVVETIVPGSIL